MWITDNPESDYSEVSSVTTVNTNFEELALFIAGMGREEIHQEIKNFQGRFQLDFTEEYLESQPLEKLRHILFAAKLQQRNGHC